MKIVIQPLTLALMAMATLPAFGMFKSLSRPFAHIGLNPVAFRMTTPQKPFFQSSLPLWTRPSGQTDKLKDSTDAYLQARREADRRYEVHTEAMYQDRDAAIRKARFWKGVSGVSLTGFGLASYAALRFYNERK